jgi:hypothetical protein
MGEAMFDGDAAGITEVDPIEIDRIAATRAAIDPDRREWRNDIVISATVELLATRGDLSESQLCEELNRMWRTASVTRPQLENALQQALAAGLVQKVVDLAGTERWQATTAAADESRQDREWAKMVATRFQKAIGERLAGSDVVELLVETQLQKLTGHLLRALARGTAGIYGVDQTATGALRPVQFDTEAMRSYIARVEPKTARQTLNELAVAAIDQDDEFGNEVVHLLVVGGLLQCFLAKRDLGRVPNLEGTRVLLDTSVLVDLVADGMPGQRVLLQLIALSRRVGVEVIVADHTIGEWQRLWEAADRERPDLVDARAIVPYTDRLIANPFIAEFLRQKVTSPDLGWVRFGLGGRRDIRRRLIDLGVNVRPAGNNTEEDIKTAQAVLAEVTELSRRDDVRGHRTKSAAKADAESCAMVARWRRNRPGEPCSAYFVAKDQLTRIAYRKVVREDPMPLTVTTAGWTMYVGSLVADDPRERAEIAEMVGTSLVRESFFGVATQYTLEEALQLAEMMSHDGESMSLDDARAAIQLNLLELIDSGSVMSNERHVVATGGAVLRRRSRRRDARAKRAEVRSGEVAADARERAEQALRELVARDSRIVNLEIEGQAQRHQLQRLKRTLVAVVIGVGIVGATTALVATHLLEGRAAAFSVVLGVVYMASAVDFCADLERPWWRFLTAAIVNAAWMVGGSLLS